jgi:hypothetical protein
LIGGNEAIYRIGGNEAIYRKLINTTCLRVQMLNVTLFLFLVLQKIFLDTIRLLAGKTNNLLEELWYYIEDGKLIQSAILLLAAQEQIRGGCSSKINGSSKKDGFGIISKRILRLSFALRWEKGSNGMAQKLREEKRALIDCTGLLVDVISQAGEPLSAYVQAHSEVCMFGILQLWCL